MKQLIKTTAVFASLFFSLAATTFFVPPLIKKEVMAKPVPDAKIQAAILLDVSGSMNGLIEQAKEKIQRTWRL